ncbi:hypothetical protein C7212DRAFT_225161 [Tuber magnatum]|uniref:Uncharacterized protein n=1 Tax=Tuber magnatum TaxID=42249 RepID=A0A317SDZ2_9PEZI|nr:hypothetical protein C7212DRAFT_225161 [Tuber magnatum]
MNLNGGSGDPQGPPNTRSPYRRSAGDGKNETIPLPPTRAQLAALVEVQERLPQVLLIAAPDAAEQSAELRRLTDKVAGEAGANQVWISEVLRG